VRAGYPLYPYNRSIETNVLVVVVCFSRPNLCSATVVVVVPSDLAVCSFPEFGALVVLDA
jgi:hypothetical protein